MKISLFDAFTAKTILESIELQKKYNVSNEVLKYCQQIVDAVGIQVNLNDANDNGNKPEFTSTAEQKQEIN